MSKETPLDELTSILRRLADSHGTVQDGSGYRRGKEQFERAQAIVAQLKRERMTRQETELENRKA